jgi:hypothetical protein
MKNVKFIGQCRDTYMDLSDFPEGLAALFNGFEAFENGGRGDGPAILRESGGGHMP